MIYHALCGRLGHLQLLTRSTGHQDFLKLSGKIMRRILRKIASWQLDELGDTSTLADPGVVDQLIALRDC
jgi:hypothetical protein